MKFFRRAIIGILIGMSLSVATLVGLIALDNSGRTLIQSINIDEPISINSQMLSSVSLIAPYKTHNVFISEEQKADFSFTTVGGTWTEIVPNGTKVDAFIRFKENGDWTDWLTLEGEPESENGDEITKTTTASGNGTKSMQYKFELYGDGINVPIIKNSEWTFIKSGKSISFDKPVSAFAAAAGSYVASKSSYIAAADTDSVISRSDWGADEDYRYMENNDEEPELIKLDDDFYEKYSEELKYSKVVKSDKNGTFKWPLQYPEKVEKFIIHHTATTKNLNNPKQAIRDIYYYHAVKRGWGDIGYNYIVDQSGKIYEGRAGGEGVIGGHAGKGNHGSIGIAVLGNYETDEVPQKVVKALGKFIYKKAKIHKIDPTGYSEFRGEKMPNIFGHSDIMSTSCPGQYLYDKLPTIRQLAKKATGKTKFVKDYDYEDLSELYYVELPQGDEIEVTMSLENIGKVNWDKKTFLVVNQSPEFNGVISFPTEKNASLAPMQETLVKPGDTATFKFKIKAGKKSDSVNMDITVVVNGEKKIGEYVVLPVTVVQTDFLYQFVDAKYPPEAMKKGELFTGWVKLKNTGNMTWRSTGTNTVKLGTDHEQDRKSTLVSPADSRIGYLMEKEVKPGDIGTFVLNLKAPDKTGNYKEYFTPVVEGVTWMKDSGMYFETSVYEENADTAIVSKTTSNQWKPGKGYIAWVELRNLSTETWEGKDLKFSFTNSKSLTITEGRLNDKDDKLDPGESGKIQFRVKVAKDAKLGKGSVLVKVMLKDKNLYKKPINFQYEIVKAAAAVVKPSEEDIRVKIGFIGNPEITGDGEFDVYSGDKFLASLKASEIAKVTYSNSKYQLTLNKSTLSYSDPIRFVPKNSTILKVNNYSHSPNWNTKLNDNQYRGKLEVRYADKNLIVINELPIEDYLKGLAEASNSDPAEKIKAIIVAARSYAKYYVLKDSKFPGQPYNLDDNPANSQNYLGYGFEIRSENISKAVSDTAYEVVTYKGDLVKTPYFSSTDGTKTRSAKDVWNWDAAFLVSVSDSYCSAKAFAGHGVGLSGCGAKGMADAGYSYKDILKHYYTGIEISTTFK